MSNLEELYNKAKELNQAEDARIEAEKLRKEAEEKARLDALLNSSIEKNKELIEESITEQLRNRLKGETVELAFCKLSLPIDFCTPVRKWNDEKLLTIKCVSYKKAKSWEKDVFGHHYRAKYYNDIVYVLELTPYGIKNLDAIASIFEEYGIDFEYRMGVETCSIKIGHSGDYYTEDYLANGDDLYFINVDQENNRIRLSDGFTKAKWDDLNIKLEVSRKSELTSGWIPGEIQTNEKGLQLCAVYKIPQNHIS